MTRELTTRPAIPKAQAPAPILQRKCSCGGQAHSSGECDECKKKKLQRKATGAAAEGIAPPIVNDVLRSPGQPLDAETRRFMEPRFGHDFSRVRVHTGAQAAESARAVNAEAYTVGGNVVFGEGRYAPRASSGRGLLAHELAHVVQQRGISPSDASHSIAPANDPAEFAADRMAQQAVAGATPLKPAPRTGPRLMRKLRVVMPSDLVPTSGQTATKTNAQMVQESLRTLAEGSEATVDSSTGVVSLSTGYCSDILGGIGKGARGGYRIGHTIGSVGGHVPLFGEVFGAIGGFLGAIGGFFAGVFSHQSAASSSKTPTGSECVCKMVGTSKWWHIEINDSINPVTIERESDPSDPKHMRSLKSGRVIVSPNVSKEYGAATMSGKLETGPTWLQLGHELCGHAYLIESEKPETDEGGASAVRDSQTGKLSVANADKLNADTTAPHGGGERFVIQRENLIRKEHGLEARGYRLRDPYCGESFSRDPAKPKDPVNFTPSSDPNFTFIQQCEFLRSQLPENKDGKYSIDQPIPEQPEGGKKKESN